ncbi:MAG: DinB family protein [Dehalococcoidia bacterium]|nr:DinB family protein [Dehalococcoidia bacterium]
MMLPVVRVLLERAETARYQLRGLLDVLPEDMLDWPDGGGGWTVRTHAAHALGTDRVITAFLSEGGSHDFAAFVAGLPDRRDEAITNANAATLTGLLREADAARMELAARFGMLGPADLAASAVVPGAGHWPGGERTLTLLDYLHAWSSHDGDHEQAIRRAIARRPDLSTIALTQRLRR